MSFTLFKKKPKISSARKHKAKLDIINAGSFMVVNRKAKRKII